MKRNRQAIKGSLRACLVSGGLLLPALLFFAGCSKESARTTATGYVMEYSYAPYGIEEFAGHIRSLRHYLFDASGIYLGEVAPSEDPALQPLELDPGTYTMVTLGNATDRTVCEGAEHGLDAFCLRVGGRTGASAECAADDLYWGTCRFTVEAGGTARFTTSMKSIHARLDVRIMWDNVPTGSTDEYTIELSGVPVRCSLSPGSATRGLTAVHIPTEDENLESGEEPVPGLYRLSTSLRAQQLTGEFTTLRYGSGTVPTLQVFEGEEAVTGPLALERAFEEWGWDPEAAPDQSYKVDMKIMGDGSVEVNQWKDASVEDWNQGGTFE